MSDWTESLFVPVLLASRDAAILALGIGGILLLLGRKIPPAWRHLIWLLVAVRLLLPTLPPSPVSWQVLFPDTTASSLPVVKAEAKPSVLPTVSPPPPAGTPLRPPTALVAESELQPLPPTIQSEPAPIPWRIFEWLACLWATGTITMVLASTLLVLRFHRRLRRLTLPTHPREADARRLLELLARENGFPKVPRLLVTAAVTAPALTGLWKPIILLPPRSLEALDEEALRFVLLHELAHLRRRDLWTNWILAILRSLHWFNPLVWWAFHRLRVEAERATDVWVLERSGAGATTRYGEALLGLLEMDCSRPARLPGVVGVLESSRDLRSRIVAIARFTGRRSRLAVTGAALLLSGIAVVGLTQAPEGKVEKAAPVAPLAATMAIRAVKRATDTPLPGAVVTLEGKPTGASELWKKTSTTDENGEVTFTLPENLARARAEVRKEGYTGHFANVRAGIPFTFQLDPVVVIGGKVLGTDASPVSGARVEVSWNSIQTGVPREEYQWSNDDPKAPIFTSTDGSWSYSLGPADFSLLDQKGRESREAPHALRVTVRHPEFSSVELRDGPQNWRSLLLARNADIVLIPDARINGRILDAKGNPVSNASIRELVVTGVNGKETRSQNDGRFAIFLKAGSHRLLVEKEGFASRLLSMSATRTEETRIDDLSLTATSPLHIRVIDAAGRALPGVSFFLFLEPRGYASAIALRSFETDIKGDALWSSPPAPDIPWTFTCFKRGYFAQRDQKPQIEDNLLVVTMQSALTITGKITDAETGNPLEKFKLVASQNLPDGERIWYSEETRPNLDPEGRYRFSITEFDRTMFRIEAEGYLARESRDYDPEAKERILTENFALDPIPVGNTNGLHILAPDGRTSAAGATLTLGQNGGSTFQFRDLAHPNDVHPPTSVSTANNQGILPFPYTPSSQRGWLTHPTGYLSVDTSDVKNSKAKTLILLRYRKLEGNLTVDGLPGAARKLMLQTSLPRPGKEDFVDFWTVTVRTDEGGNFAIDQLVPSEIPYRIRMIDEVSGNDYPDTIALVSVGAEPVAPLKLTFQQASRVRVRGRFVTNRGESLDGTNFESAFLNVREADAPVEFFDMIQPEANGSFETPPYSPGTYLLRGFIKFSNAEDVLFEKEDFVVPENAITTAPEGIYDIGDIPIN